MMKYPSFHVKCSVCKEEFRFDERQYHICAFLDKVNRRDRELNT